MGIEEVSAVAAMGALRAQIEERLNRIEDYRALKALDIAIATVRPPVPANTPISLPDPVPVMPKAPEFQPVTTGTVPSSIMQRLSMHHGAMTTGKAVSA